MVTKKLFLILAFVSQCGPYKSHADKYENTLKTMPTAKNPPYSDPVSDSEIKETVCWYVAKNIKHPWYDQTGPDYVFGSIPHKGKTALYSEEIKEACGLDWCSQNKFDGNYSSSAPDLIERTFCDPNASEYREKNKMRFFKDFQYEANCGGSTPLKKAPNYTPGVSDLVECAVWRSQCLEALETWANGPRNDPLGDFVIDELMCLEY